ncbi:MULTISPECIES: hypothetical protein [Pseudomonas]|uniref:Uncharacterized protein n=1 Tax=Pseudomonas aphyarum TaxID=2942629 RepID=A0ABT5PPP9_9PSED|nr:hypothetical protein [Pseudomonas aphyarum]MDD0971127.1 hypothetical protein [Pseudomonas aphyarum]MDD1125907.1 hypothetical protein [Pseudomonas aphyarum]
MERLIRAADEGDGEGATEPPPTDLDQVSLEPEDKDPQDIDETTSKQMPLHVVWNGLMLEQ